MAADGRGREDEASPRRWLDRFDPAATRERATHVNDGVLAVAGLSEGLSGAHASPEAIYVAVLVSAIAGALAVAGARLGEGLAEREAEQSLVADERRLLDLSPAEEVAELARHFEAKGVSAATARLVAEEMSAADALSAQLEIEHGIRQLTTGWGATKDAAWAGVSFLLGAAMPVAIAYLYPGEWLAVFTLGAVLLSLAVTSLVLARLGHTRIVPTMLRSLLIGLASLAVAWVAASLLT